MSLESKVGFATSADNTIPKAPEVLSEGSARPGSRMVQEDVLRRGPPADSR